MPLHDRDYMRADDDRPGPSITLPVSPLSLLLFVMGGVFVVQHLFGYWMEPVGEGRFIPRGGVSIEDLQGGRYGGVLTSLFVHGGFLHFAANALLIFFCGRFIQRHLGGKAMLAIFFLGGLAGTALELGTRYGAMVYQPDSPLAAVSANSVLLGASTGAFALLFAFTTMAPFQEIWTFLPIRLYARTLGLAMILVTGAFALAQFLGVGLPESLANVAHFGHLGGALAGIFYMRAAGAGGAPPDRRQLTRERLEREFSKGRFRLGEDGDGDPWGAPFRPAKRKPQGAAGAEVQEIERPPAETLAEKADRVLDKIREQGKDSLTEAERRILDQFRRQLQREEGRKR